LPNLSLGGFAVKDVRLRFRPDDSPARNPDRDTFEGEGTLVIPNTLTIVGKVKFIGGSLDSIMARVAVDPVTGAGVPVPPLFSLTGGTVSVAGIGTGNFSIFLGVDITLADARLANFVKLSNAGIRYTAPGSLSGSSDLEILRTNIAEAALDFVNVPNEKSFAFDASLVLVEGFPVLSVGGGVRVGAKRKGSNFSFFVNGTVRGKVQIPKVDNFVFNAIDAIPFIDFPSCCSAPRSAPDSRPRSSHTTTNSPSTTSSTSPCANRRGRRRCSSARTTRRSAKSSPSACPPVSSNAPGRSKRCSRATGAG
jgi:hypothetical protein